MDLRQLTNLVAVVDHGSFSAAADALHTVQSNVSAHVARLEAEVGATLVDRRTGQATAEGEVVVARARRVLGEVDALVADAASLRDNVVGTVRLGMIGTTARWLAPRLLATMADRHPQVALVVVDATTTSLIPQLLAGQLDLAVVNLPLREPDLVVEELFSESTILVVPTGHPLARRRKVALADLAGHPLLLEPRGTNFRDHLDRSARAAGVELTAQSEVDGMRLLASLAFEGFGATLVPASAAPSWLSGAWQRVVVSDLEGRSVGLAARRRSYPAAPERALRDVVAEIVATEGPHQPGITVTTRPPGEARTTPANHA